MVGIVLVSHSRALALSVQELVRSMSGPALPLAIAAGTGDHHAELGTDAVEISEAILAVKGPEGVLVLMDMGSAILSSETALDLLDEPLRANVRFCAAPFVEGAVAAGVTANLGAPLDQVCTEALSALKQKQAAVSSNQPEGGTEPSVKKPENGSSSKPCERIRLTVRNPHGLHARPAARLIAATRPFRSEITVRNLSNQRGAVSVKSLSSLAGLEILQDHEIEIEACGEDAPLALKKISQLVESGFGDALTAPSNGAVPPRKAEPAMQPQNATGPVPISDGIAIGPGIYFQDVPIEIPPDKTGDPAAEVERLRAAVRVVQQALEGRRDRMGTAVGAANAEIYDAQILALQDPELTENAARIIRDERVNAALAWDRAHRQVVSRYESLHDPYLRERAADLEDVGRQVLELLVAKTSTAPAPTEPGILIADNLTPFQASSLDRKSILGVILLDGGPTAHSAILLRALGIPAVVQARPVFAQTKGPPRVVAFDGSTGKIWIDPDPGFLSELRDRRRQAQARTREEQMAGSLPAVTLDGHRVEILANIGGAAEVEAAIQFGAEGVGLLRTEFLFLDRDSAPTEEEQTQALLAITAKMKGMPLTIRTLDVGGDKELSYLKMPPEENPFLGVRAVRLCFSHEELFMTQLRAILRAARGQDVRIMFPMIAHVGDLGRAKGYLDRAHRELEKERVPHLWPVKTGIMIEIPSAAIEAESLAAQADFFSIGTNDLVQYALAADRGNPDLAAYQDALHPSVLRLAEMVVRGARRHGRPVAVCGEAAADVLAAGLFVGLGVEELSMSGAKIPSIKASLRGHSLARLQQLARTALGCTSADEVRTLSRKALLEESA